MTYHHYPLDTPLADLVIGECAEQECSSLLLSDYVWRTRAQATRPAGYARHDGDGYCAKHYARRRRAGLLKHEPQNRRAVRCVRAPQIRECGDCGRAYSTSGMRARHPEVRAVTVRGLAGYCMKHYYARREGRELLWEDRREEILDDWEMLRDTGESIDNAWRRLGLPSRAALEARLKVARAAGDRRGSKVPFGHDMRARSAA